jgi:hypothetical protein
VAAFNAAAFRQGLQDVGYVEDICDGGSLTLVSDVEASARARPPASPITAVFMRS